MIPLRLTSGCSACGDDADNVGVTLSPDDENEAALDGFDGDEAVFELGVELVEDFEGLDVMGKSCEASSNETPCLSWLDLFLDSSHSNSTETV